GRCAGARAERPRPSRTVDGRPGGRFGARRRGPVENRSNPMKVLVTGGSGFIGSHVAEALSEAGHEVTVLDRHRSPYLRPAQRYVAVDILDRDAMRSVTEGHEAVYHLAGIAHLDIGLEAPIE